MMEAMARWACGFTHQGIAIIYWCSGAMQFGPSWTGELTNVLTGNARNVPFLAGLSSPIKSLVFDCASSH